MSKFSKEEKIIYSSWLIGKKPQEIAKEVGVEKDYVNSVIKRINAQSGTVEGSIVLLGKMGLVEPIVKPHIERRSWLGTGYWQDFLGVQIKLPELTEAHRQNAYIRNGSEVINYTHFSLALCKARRFPIWVGWNIDGGNIKRVSRNGLTFTLDPSIPQEFQVGEEIYGVNRLDRGHIARRADLAWGDVAEARRANKDSFYFTNVVPLKKELVLSETGGLWRGLSDTVFEDTDVENLKVSLFGGPVFRDDDKEFRGVKLPREYWKVIVFIEDSKLKVKGFMLTQNLDVLQVLDLDQFRVYQVALKEIEARCGLTFPASLKAADTIGNRLSLQPEPLSQRRPLGSTEEIDWS